MHPSQALTLPSALHNNRFGIMACCFLKYDFKQHCQVSREIGVSYIESFALKLNPEIISAVEAKKHLQENKLELLLMVADIFDIEHAEEYITTLHTHLRYWQEVGLTSFVIIRGEKTENREEYQRVLLRAAEVVRSYGLTPLTQNYFGGMIESPNDLLACKEIGIGIHFDTQQFHKSGYDAREAWELLSADTVHIHIADRHADSTPAAFGSGAIGIAPLLRRIHGSGYRGAITLDPKRDAGADAQDSIQTAYDFCRDTLRPLDACGLQSAGHTVHHTSDVPTIHTEWGALHWLSSASIVDSCEQTVGFVTIKPNCSNPSHLHPEDQEVIVIRSGTCLHMCGDHQVRLSTGDVLFVPAGQAHQAFNDGDENCEMLVLYPTGARGFEKVRDLIPAQ